MELFKKQIQFLEDLQKRIIFDVLRKSIERNGFVVKDYVINKQLYDKGIDGNKKRLKGYTRTTIRYKIAKNQPADRTTLKDEGDFHASITIDAYDDRMVISSDVNHAKHLVSRYGKDIMKPTRENMVDFFDKYFIPNLKKELNGKFAK